MVARPRPEAEPDIADEAPITSELTDYDYTMLASYLRLLDAESEGADWREVALIVLKADPEKDYGRAKRIYDSHIARAHWMAEWGYRHLQLEVGLEW